MFLMQDAFIKRRVIRPLLLGLLLATLLGGCSSDKAEVPEEEKVIQRVMDR